MMEPTVNKELLAIKRKKLPEMETRYELLGKSIANVKADIAELEAKVGREQ